MSERNTGLRRGLVSALVALALFSVGPNRGISRVAASELRRTPTVRAVQRVRASVVNIHGEKTLTAADEDFNPFQSDRRVSGMGTGVVIDERGYVITNLHVVADVEEIEVTTADGTSLTAELIANDPATDLAVIKINAESPLPVIEIGTSQDLMPGEPVIAVGNAYGYEHTVTRGIISALHRTVQVGDAQKYEDLIQTDASINPGNSGGPLLNIDGEVIGVNVAVRVGAQGIGFAIPVDNAMAVAARLLNTRRLGKSWHGIVAGDAASGGVVVEAVDTNSPASQSGVKQGDRIVSVAGKSVRRALDIERALLDRRPGDEVSLVVRRDDQKVPLDMVLGGVPKSGSSNNDPVWSVLGLKLEKISPTVFERYRSRYRGGLAVLGVRPGSPAARQGIRRGDVLVGMHVWETVSLDNVKYILNRPDFERIAPLKFYILRGNETLYGHLTVSSRGRR